jgi:hypothetical protein
MRDVYHYIEEIKIVRYNSAWSTRRTPNSPTRYYKKVWPGVDIRTHSCYHLLNGQPRCEGCSSYEHSLPSLTLLSMLVDFSELVIPFPWPGEFFCQEFHFHITSCHIVIIYISTTSDLYTYVFFIMSYNFVLVLIFFYKFVWLVLSVFLVPFDVYSLLLKKHGITVPFPFHEFTSFPSTTVNSRILLFLFVSAECGPDTNQW